MKNNLLKILLGVVIIVLGYLVFNSINTPVKFEKQLSLRSDEIVERLKDIRTAQTLFRNQKGRYTGSFDTLIDFIKTGKIPEVKMIPDPKDTTFTRTISDTIGYIVIFDSLYATKYKLESLSDLKVIPYSQGELFQLTAGKISKGGVDVSVFEVLAPFEAYTKELDKQLVINRVKEIKDRNRYPGLKLGSMNEATTDGNWE